MNKHTVKSGAQCKSTRFKKLISMRLSHEQYQFLTQSGKAHSHAIRELINEKMIAEHGHE